MLFCGAGVSSDAGYPLFKGLVDYVYSCIPAHTPTPEEAAALKNGEYDRALNFLERRLRNNEVRASVIARLTSRPRTLALHDALLKIARQPDGVHLVTTNFDRLFDKARQKAEHPSIGIDVAPKLPTPKSRKWNSIVHLHGMIDKHADPMGMHLVLTTADFGAAYLTEGWASRFIAELFRRYRVVFVGYRADDTVMRYILDALDADARLQERVYTPFAFASYDPNVGEEAVASEWRAKGVEPIPYPELDRRHDALRQCLARWASDCTDGQEGRAQVVARVSLSQPSILPPSEVERLLWALADPTGVPARELIVKDADGNTKPRASFAWREPLAAAGLLSASSSEHASGVTDGFVGMRATAVGVPLSTRGWAVIQWLRAHLGDEEFYRHVAANSGLLHPEVASTLRRDVVARTLQHGSVDLSLAWLVLTSPATSIAFGHAMTIWDVKTLCDAVKRWPTIELLDHEIGHALTPFLRFSDPDRQWRYEGLFGHKPADRSTQDYWSADLMLRCGKSAYMIEETLKDNTEGLCRVAMQVNMLLTRALDLLGGVARYDPGPVRRIEALSAGSHDEDWTILIRLAWDSFRACNTHDPIQAKLLFSMWRRSSHSIHRQLAIKAAGDTHNITGSDCLALLLEGS